MDNKGKVDVIIFSLGIFLLLLGAFNASAEKVAGGGVCFATGIALVIFYKFDVESLKLFGLEAKLQKKIDEAEKILERLRGISIPVSEIAILVASKTGRTPEKITRRELHRYVETIQDGLLEIGVPLEKLEEVKRGWYSIISMEMAQIILKGVRDAIDEKISRLQQGGNEKRLLFPEIRTNDDLITKLINDRARVEQESLSLVFNRNYGYKETSRQLRSFIAQLDSLSKDEVDEVNQRQSETWLDLQTLIAERKLRRPEQWFSEEY